MTPEQPSPPTPEQQAEIREKAAQEIMQNPAQAVERAEAAEKRADTTAITLQARMNILVQRAAQLMLNTNGGNADAVRNAFRGVALTINGNTVANAQINAAPQAPNTAPNAPTNAPNAPHPNLDASLRPRFTALDPTEQALVNRVMTSLEPAFTSVVANQENLISALQILNPTQLNSFAQEVNALGNSATRDQIQAAVGRIGLNDAQGRVLVIVAQYRRELLNAPAAGPQQAPPAPFSDTERKGYAAEVSRLNGLSGQGSVLQRAMGRLQLAFKGVDLAKLPSVERAEGMGKFVSILVAIVELLAALKNPTEDVAKKQAAEQANMSPEERNRKQGIDTLMREGAAEQPPGSGIYVVTGDFGEGFRPLQFAFEGGQWKWGSEGETGRIPAGNRPYGFPAGLSPAQVALRTKWNQIGAGLGQRNTQAVKEVKEKTEKETKEKEEKEKPVKEKAAKEQQEKEAAAEKLKLERGHAFIRLQTDGTTGIDNDTGAGPVQEGTNEYWIGIDGDTNDLRVRYDSATHQWQMKEEDAATWWNPEDGGRPANEWSGNGLTAVRRIATGLWNINNGRSA